MTTPAPQLANLKKWWRIEHEDATAEARRQRLLLPHAQRTDNGRLLTHLVFARQEAPPKSRPARGEPKRQALYWFRRTDRKPFERHRVRSGFPAIVFPAEPESKTEILRDDEIQCATIVRVTQSEICLRLAPPKRSFATQAEVHLEQEDSAASFERGAAALVSVALEPRLKVLKELLFGDKDPAFTVETDGGAEVDFRDAALDPSQRRAVERAQIAEDALLVIGPPGTGKTRTLVEIVRQGLLRKERILVTAASNVAVDNLARRLAATGVHVLRLGAPGKVAPDLFELTLSHKLAKIKESKDAQALFDEAKRLSQKPGRRTEAERKRIGATRREAHQLRDMARAKVLRRSRVVCATAGGVDAVPLGDEKFDRVLLDEATQVPDPLSISALIRGKVIVLAGDPNQLPPTVVAQDKAVREGLSSTLFERCLERWPSSASVMLTCQYRMSEELMRFPSEAHYDSRLVAGDGNRTNRLQELIDSPISHADNRPWRLIDTQDLGSAEALDETTASYHNPVHLAIVVAELRRVIALGVAPVDLAAICPYAAQVTRLRHELRDELNAGLEIGTVDGFQGREKEVVIVDLVRSNSERDIGFLRDVRRTNVAITRAKRQLLVVADGRTLDGHPYYRSLFDAAQRDEVLERPQESPDQVTGNPPTRGT